MARKRPLRFRRIQSFLKQAVALFLFAWLGFVGVLSFPALSASPGTGGIPSISERVQEGKRFYDAGEFDRAATLWQEAAEAYIKAGNKEEMLESLINSSQAMQILGFHAKARDRLLQGLELYRWEGDRLAELAAKHPHIFQWLDSEAAARQEQSAAERRALQIGYLEEQRDSLSLTQAIALRSLGNALRQTGDLENSQAVLELSLEVAERLQSQGDAIAAKLDLGNTAQALGNRERNREDPVTVALGIAKLFDAGLLNNGPVQRALEAFKGYNRQATSYYNDVATALSASPTMKVQARLNHLSLLLALQSSWQKAFEEAARREPEANLSYRRDLELYFSGQIQQLFAEVAPQISSLPPSRVSVLSQLKLARLMLNQLKLVTVADRASWRDKVVDALRIARDAASAWGDKRSTAYAIGYLGSLYEQEALDAKDPEKQKQLFASARDLTEQALTSLDEKSLDRDRDVAYFLYWQLGRILKNQGNITTATSAYNAALQALKDLRNELAAIDRDAQFLFASEVEPVYRELVGLLLSQDKTISNSDLTKARDVIEALQLAELDNYFQDPCSETQQVNIDDFIDRKAQNSAVIYPIVIENTGQQQIRLEIILKLPEQAQLRHYSTIISRKKFDETIGNLYQSLYGEVVAILSTRAEPEKIREFLKNTNPRLLPLLAEVYDWLIRPLEPDLAEIETLVFVLDGQLQNIPIAALYDGQKYLIQKYSIALTPSLQLTDPKPLPRRNLQVLAAGVSTENQGRDALPEVKDELEKIGFLFPKSTILLDEQFSAQKFQEKLKNGDFPVVHLATHGKFSSNPEQTWIQTSDDRIKVSNLDDFLQTRGKIGLLVLSACETAQGDKRAVLGLAGVAVRAGASSTLATLWNVEDKSAALLMEQFYEALKGSAENPAASKAEALRRAQLSLLNNPDYNHPAFWAPYVLVGNWL